MATWIKICGLTNIGDVRLAAQLGADALGFVFHPSSRRFCPPARAQAILRDFPGCLSVGVWFDAPADEIVDTALAVGCARIQTYDPAVAIRLKAQGFEVIPAIPLGATLSPDAWPSLCASWEGRIVVDRSRSQCEKQNSNPESSLRSVDTVFPLFGSRAIPVLAGGLCPENIAKELTTHRPAGVDVASGLESLPGRKDPAKMEMFIKEVRRWDAMAGSTTLVASSCPKR